MHIREMSRRHIKQVAQIEQACFSQPWSEKSLEAELDNPNAIFLVAEEDHIVAGYMGMHTVLDEGYIANIAISQQFRRRGTATLLTKRMMEYAREKQLSFLTLEVRQSNEAAISLYRKMGFDQVGQRRNFYAKPCEDAILMTLYFKPQEREDKR